MALTDPLVLPHDVVVVPVHRVREDVRNRLDCSSGDYIVTRPTGRARSLLVDGATADLLQAFRRPTEVGAAVVAYAARGGEDANSVLDGVYPALRRLHAAGLLVPAASTAASGLTFRLAAGAELDGWRIIRGIQALEDSEVYRARGESGDLAAIKIARAPGDERIRAQLRHELRVLEQLPSGIASRVLGHGTADDRAYIAVEWVDGADALSSARGLAAERDADRELVELCAGIFDSYAAVHAAGIVHGDVHPKNVLVGPTGMVRLIDFGLARVLDADARQAPPARQGVPYFFEPEYAHAPGSPATPAGEIYGLSALAYLLLTGDHYLDFPLEREAFLHAITTDAPLPFTRRGRSAWPTVERVLARGLAKRVEARAPSATWMASSFRTALDDRRPTARAPEGPPQGSTRPATDPLDAYLCDGPVFEQGLGHAPTGSLHYGAAGIAYALYRCSMLSDSAEALAAADAWAARASAGSDDSRWWNPAIGVTAQRTGPNALHHTELGVTCVQALIAHARWEPQAVRAFVRRYVTTAATVDGTPDLTHGVPGALLGCAMLAEAIPDDPLLPRDEVIACGELLASRVAGLPAPDALGIAHGRAGVAYALLRWSDAVNLPPNGDLGERLDALRAHADDTGSGTLRWPARVGEAIGQTSPFVSGWCNGTAGFAQLYLLAYRLLGEDRYAECGLAAARATATDDAGGATVCCGGGGRVYALLAAHRATGAETWLTKARTLASAMTLPSAAPHTPTHSLYKGALGIQLLLREIETPERARHPMFEAEGWPRRGSISRLSLKGAR